MCVGRWWNGNIGKARFTHIRERATTLLVACGAEVCGGDMSHATWAAAGKGNTCGGGGGGRGGEPSSRSNNVGRGPGRASASSTGTANAGNRKKAAPSSTASPSSNDPAARKRLRDAIATAALARLEKRQRNAGMGSSASMGEIGSTSPSAPLPSPNKGSTGTREGCGSRAHWRDPLLTGAGSSSSSSNNKSHSHTSTTTATTTVTTGGGAMPLVRPASKATGGADVAMVVQKEPCHAPGRGDTNTAVTVIDLCGSDSDSDSDSSGVSADGLFVVNGGTVASLGVSQLCQLGGITALEAATLLGTHGGSVEQAKAALVASILGEAS